MCQSTRMLFEWCYDIKFKRIVIVECYYYGEYLFFRFLLTIFSIIIIFKKLQYDILENYIFKCNYFYLFPFSSKRRWNSMNNWKFRLDSELTMAEYDFY